MLKHTLTVPTIAQSKDMSCWHASSLMIWQYWQGVSGRQGPMHTLAKVWEKNTGLAVDPASFTRLAEHVGMKKLPKKAKYTAADLVGLLQKHGPIWCAGNWYGFGHVVVLTGVEGQKVFINDPDGGVKKSGSVEWFNTRKFDYIDGCLMYKDPDAY